METGGVDAGRMLLYPPVKTTSWDLWLAFGSIFPHFD